MTVQPHGGAPRVGMVGAGQLARMTHQAGISLGLSLRVLAAAPDDGAALVARDVQVGRPDSFEALEAFAAGCDVVTFDHELVDTRQLAQLEAAGRRVRPSAATVAVAQDKGRQRTLFAERGLPVPPFRRVAGLADLTAFAAEHGWPVVAKACRGGYDGRGVWVVSSPEQAAKL
ncbi:MAG TPA: ATP-grasp domain-containing protein, partial [Dehalococcoidia bacterium]|nr:ATP-grasp domain-containing protein [Dehalococcoidia bacterium]